MSARTEAVRWSSASDRAGRALTVRRFALTDAIDLHYRAWKAAQPNG